MPFPGAEDLPHHTSCVVGMPGALSGNQLPKAFVSISQARLAAQWQVLAECPQPNWGISGEHRREGGQGSDSMEGGELCSVLSTLCPMSSSQTGRPHNSGIECCVGRFCNVLSPLPCKSSAMARDLTPARGIIIRTSLICSGK